MNRFAKPGQAAVGEFREINEARKCLGRWERKESSWGKQRRPPLILVVGVGNVLFRGRWRGGPSIWKLQKDPLSKIVCAEVGTAVLGALHLFEWADKILAVDALQAGGKPGNNLFFGNGKRRDPALAAVSAREGYPVRLQVPVSESTADGQHSRGSNPKPLPLALICLHPCKLPFLRQFRRSPRSSKRG